MEQKADKWWEKPEEELDTSDQADIDMIVENLYLGSIKSAMNHDVLEVYEINAVMNVTENDTRDRIPAKCDYLHIPLLDDTEQDLLPHIPQALSFITKNLSQQKNLLIHCQAGRSRSASIVLAYLMHS